MSETTSKKKMIYEEAAPKTAPGIPMLLLNLFLMIASIVGFFYFIFRADRGPNTAVWICLVIVCALYWIVGSIMFVGLKSLKPNESMVFTLFGKYYGTLKEEGFYFMNPFVEAVMPTANATTNPSTGSTGTTEQQITNAAVYAVTRSKKISLKVKTLNNDKQKINDSLGNPIIIGIVVTWKVVNPTKAVFNVDNYSEFLSIQCDSALRNIVRLYPYDASNEDNEKTLRGSSQDVAQMLKEAIQEKVHIAGIEIEEARITHLSYAPEIAAAMLQRQQASAIVDARQMIVEGAVGMVEMALEKLNANNIVHLDEERKAAMVSNLLVVLCGNKDAQPVVNSGSIY